jgi:hypothetical protein
MLRKLAVSVFVLGVAAFGCSSNSGDDTGKGGSSATGKGGSTASGGGGGSSAGGSAGGATGGSAGGATGGSSAGGSSAGGSSAGGSSAGGSSAGGSGGGGVMVMENCTVTTSGAAEGLTPETFCENYLPNCGTAVAGYTNMGTCITSYMALTTTQQACRSYHLCWGVEGKPSGTPNPTTHCPHTVGNGACM